VLDWCARQGISVIPYGGGSSVVGGVEPRFDDPVLTVDTTAMNAVLEIDRTSRAARIQAGALGPVIENQLRPYDLTLRHFPQSFGFSSLGGWLATRAGGHFATLYTHIDDLTESLRVVTPVGVSESRRLPGSGAGPSPDRLFLGSEGALGIITEAWMRVQDRPRYRASASVHFGSWRDGVDAVRAIAQAGLFPANCRLLDAGEAGASAGVTDGSTVLVLGFESADHPLDAWATRAMECAADHGGAAVGGVRVSGGAGAAGRSDDDAAGTWRAAFLRAPYGRDAMVALGCIAETFETAVTWDGLGPLHDAVMSKVGAAVTEVCGGGSVTCRFTHVYPDGAAPYFTVLAPSAHGSQLAQWQEIKGVAANVLLDHGGTITHHHAVGRDHRRWYDRQRPELFADVLRAAKRRLDPAGVLNPGVLVDR
jgi:alkyldihydroxyacetonephosphate synthase